MRGCMALARWLLMIFNVLFLISGLAIMIIGAIAVVKFKEFSDVLGKSATSVPILLVVVGCIVILVAMIGCAGALKNSYGMLTTFAVLMLIVFILEIAGGIAAYVNKNKFSKAVDMQLKNSLRVYDAEPRTAKIDLDITIWNHLQKKLHCCGVAQYGDWLENRFLNQTGSVPDSCCKKPVPDCGAHAATNPEIAKGNINENGCSEAFKKWADSNSLKIGAVGVGIAFLQIIGIILACAIGKESKKNPYDTV